MQSAIPTPKIGSLGRGCSASAAYVVVGVIRARHRALDSVILCYNIYLYPWRIHVSLIGPVLRDFLDDIFDMHSRFVPHVFSNATQSL